MQTSGTFSGLSDGVKKQIVTHPPRPAKPAPALKVPTTAHRRGGHAKHGGRAK